MGGLNESEAQKIACLKVIVVAEGSPANTERQSLPPCFTNNATVHQGHLRILKFQFDPLVDLVFVMSHKFLRNLLPSVVYNCISMNALRFPSSVPVMQQLGIITSGMGVKCLPCSSENCISKNSNRFSFLVPVMQQFGIIWNSMDVKCLPFWSE